MKNEDAYRMFLAYRGSKFSMSRDYVDEEYRAYGISKELESYWAKKEMAEIIVRIETEAFNCDDWIKLFFG